MEADAQAAQHRFGYPSGWLRLLCGQSLIPSSLEILTEKAVGPCLLFLSGHVLQQTWGQGFATLRSVLWSGGGTLRTSVQLGKQSRCAQCAGWISACISNGFQGTVQHSDSDTRTHTHTVTPLAQDQKIRPSKFSAGPRTFVPFRFHRHR